MATSIAPVLDGVKSTPLGCNYEQGPHQQSVDSLMDTTAALNGAFSELAWANARQNGGRPGCAGEAALAAALPSWPPKDPNKGWGHTYPVQSKRGETIMGHDQLQYDTTSPPGGAPFLVSPVVADANRGESNELYRKFANTDVPRVNGTPAAREYDLALDIADKIVRGDTLTSTFYDMAIPGPASYANKDDLVELSSPAIGASSCTNKRLENLVSPDRAYGAARDTHKRKNQKSEAKQQQYAEAHPEQRDVSMGEYMSNSIKGIVYDVQHWDKVREINGNDTVASVQFVIGRDNRWAYLLLLLFIVGGIAAGVAWGVTRL